MHGIGQSSDCLPQFVFVLWGQLLQLFKGNWNYIVDGKIYEHFKDENTDCLDDILNAAREIDRHITKLLSKKNKRKSNDPKPMHFYATRS
jgi:hypothetical protein